MPFGASVDMMPASVTHVSSTFNGTLAFVMLRKLYRGMT